MSPQFGEPTTFIDMLTEIRRHHTLAQIAKGTGYSPSYICDLANGNRLPTVAVVNKLCAWLGRGPIGQYTWHRAAARAHGWNI